MHFLIVFYTLGLSTPTEALEIDNGDVVMHVTATISPSELLSRVSESRMWVPMVDPSNDLGEFLPKNGGRDRCQIFIKL